MKGSWKSVAEIFLLQVALGSATFSPHRSRCLRTGNFSPPIQSKNITFLLFFLTFKQHYTYMISQIFLINIGNTFFMDVTESPLILYLVIRYVFTANNLLRFRLWYSSVTRLKYRFFYCYYIYLANKFII